MFWLDSRPLLNPSTTFITPILYLCSLVPTPSFSSLCLMLMNTHSHFPSFFSSFHVFPSVYSSFYLSFHSPLSSIVSCPTPNLFQQLFVSTPFLFHTLLYYHYILSVVWHIKLLCALLALSLAPMPHMWWSKDEKGYKYSGKAMAWCKYVLFSDKMEWLSCLQYQEQMIAIHLQ